VLKTRHDRGMNLFQVCFRGREERQSQYRSFPLHGFMRIDFDISAVTDDNHAAARAKHRKISRKVDVRQHFRDEIHASSTGEIQQLLLITGFFVIEYIMGALLQRERAAFLTAARADNSKTRCASKLN